jgi:hypothetical protein
MEASRNVEQVQDSVVMYAVAPARHDGELAAKKYVRSAEGASRSAVCLRSHMHAKTR